MKREYQESVPLPTISIITFQNPEHYKNLVWGREADKRTFEQGAKCCRIFHSKPFLSHTLVGSIIKESIIKSHCL